MNKPIALIILDGWGHREGKEHNAIADAKTPFFDALWHKYPHALLNASEEHVGLPTGTIGNSEIGHMTMGAGRVIDTDLVRISKAIKENKLLENDSIQKLFEHIKKNNSSLHLIGMVSPAGVHSHQEHLYGVLDAAKQSGITKVVIHAFTDGRDSPPKSNAGYLKELETVLEKAGIGHIATVTGRYFGMDRDKNWQRTEKAEKALFNAEGERVTGLKASDILQGKYQQGIIDEYVEPIVFLDSDGKHYSIADNDGIFFFNFRSDRPRQLSYKIMERAKKQNLFFVTMTQYDPNIECLVAFPPEKPDTTLAAEISKAGLKQSHIAETEKYAHVTFFFNGGKQDTHPGERHFLIDSQKVATHDLAPEMRAKEIADRSISSINEGDDFLVINFANADMVGHTANKPAIITAVETVDTELKRVVEAVLDKGGIAIVTADHGNAEQNIDATTGELHTAHTLNLVPFIIVSSDLTIQSVAKNPSPQGSLANIAPTILQLLEIKNPVSMTGESLLS